MSVEVVYRVVKTNGELAGEYMDKKLADAHDQKLDCIYTLVELMLEKSDALNEAAAEKIAEHMVDNKTEIMSALKKVKDLPATGNETKDAQSTQSLAEGKAPIKDTNIEILDTEKKVAAG